MEYDFYVCSAALNKVLLFKAAEASALIEAFGSPVQIFSAGRKAFLSRFPKASAIGEELFNPSLMEWARSEIDWCLSNGIKPLCPRDALYPKRLSECPDAPLVLYALGDADLNAPRMLSVVGTRRATYHGKAVCRELVLNLRKHCGLLSIVSGLAFGIDATAHDASIDASLPTIAVLPTGLDRIYPSFHRNLAKRILSSGGALVSDFPRNTFPQPFQFLRRNRIIAGMTDCCLLAESFAKGGGLITTNLADSYNREVAAIPGRVTDESFEGCNNLIAKNKAHLVTGAAAIASLMNWKPVSAEKPVPDRNVFHAVCTDPCGRAILELLKEGSMSFDALVSRLSSQPSDSGSRNFRIPEIGAALTALEMDGAVACQGREYERVRPFTSSCP